MKKFILLMFVFTLLLITNSAFSQQGTKSKTSKAAAAKSIVLKINNVDGLAQRMIDKQNTKGCHFVCYEWSCEPNPGGTVHCGCVRGGMECD